MTIIFLLVLPVFRGSDNLLKYSYFVVYFP